jgi:transposase
MDSSITRILALDLGKFKTVLCAMELATREHHFESLVTTPAAVEDLLARHRTSDPSHTLVVIETCDVAGWVHDLCVAAGVKITIANPRSDAWRWSKVKRKTDKDDALKLARLTLLDQLSSVHLPSPVERQKRRLILHRRSIVEQRTRCRNQIRSIFSQQGLALARGGRQWTIAGIQQLGNEARPIAECEVIDLWRGRLHAELELLASIGAQLKVIETRLDDLADDRVKLLQSVKGVGPRLAEAVVLHLDDPHRFKREEEVAAYAGLVPRQIESGEMKRSGRITRHGPTLLRSLLVESAWTVWRHNAWARVFVEKLCRGSRSRRKVAIIALARKLLIMLWAMLRKNQPYRPELFEKIAQPT